MSTTTTTPARRSFLAALTAAIAAPAAATLPALPAKAEPMPEEARELLALGEKLAGLLDEWREAAARFAEARALYEKLRPAVPQGLAWTYEHGTHMRHEAVEQRDLDGNCVMWEPPRGGRQPLLLYKSNYLQARILRFEIPRSTKEGKAARRLVRLAKKYEADVEAAWQSSDLEKHRGALGDVRIAIQDLVYEEILAIEPRGPDGLAVYARALLALRETGVGGGHSKDGATLLGVAIARTLLQPDGVST